MQLSEHFSLTELTRSDTAARMGWDNIPTPGALDNLFKLASKLEIIRAFFGKPIIVTSGYRSKLVNDAVGSKDGSAHRFGLAADFIIPGLSLDEIMRGIIKVNQEVNLGYDQLIKEFNSWIHLGLADNPRYQNLIIDKDGVKPFV